MQVKVKHLRIATNRLLRLFILRQCFLSMPISKGKAITGQNIPSDLAITQTIPLTGILTEDEHKSSTKRVHTLIKTINHSND